jgi:hypothetical protein
MKYEVVHKTGCRKEEPRIENLITPNSGITNSKMEKRFM